MTDLFYKLPASFQREITNTLPCGCTKKETVTFELKINPRDTYSQNNKRRREYDIYYSPRCYSVNTPPNIQVKDGRYRYEDLEEAIDYFLQKHNLPLPQ